MLRIVGKKLSWEGGQVVHTHLVKLKAAADIQRSNLVRVIVRELTAGPFAS